MTVLTPKASRPGMQNYGIAADTAGLLPWSWADERLERARNYWIASTRADGRPHVAPVWGVWMEGTLIFGADRDSLKARNLTARSEVVVHLESGDEVVIVEGKAEQVLDEALKARMYPLYTRKYGFDPSAEPLEGSLYLRVTPKVALGWLEKDFPNTATRWRFD